MRRKNPWIIGKGKYRINFSTQEGYVFLFHWPAEKRRELRWLAYFSTSNYDVCLILALFKYILHGGMHSPLALFQACRIQAGWYKSHVAPLTWHWSQAHQPCCVHFPSVCWRKYLLIQLSEMTAAALNINDVLTKHFQQHLCTKYYAHTLH